MTQRQGRFRLLGPHGRCVVRYRLAESTVALRLEIAAAGVGVALRLRLRPPVSFLAANRSDGELNGSTRHAWDLRALGDDGGLGLLMVHLALMDVGLEHDRPPDGFSPTRLFARRLLDRFVREAVARADPRARQVAQTFPPGSRAAIYRWIAEDGTGRVAQMAAACPGILTIAWGLCETTPGGGVRSRELLARIVVGLPLRVLLSDASTFALSPHVLTTRGLPGTPEFRLRYVSTAEVDAARRSLRLLIHRARSLVQSEDLLGCPPPSFAPEDIPRHPVRNARWYAAMRCASHVLWRVPEPELRESLSSFVSAHAALLASRSRTTGLEHLLQALVRFARATGRVPRRGSNPRSYLTAYQRWAREGDRDTPAGKLRELLRRVPALGLGEVVAVRALTSELALSQVEGLPLPSAPPVPGMAGLEARLLSTPEALAEEGARMHHCVAAWLPQLLEGGTWVYAVRIGDAHVTVAIERRADGLLAVAEARRKDNLLPTPAQTRIIARWVEAMNVLEAGVSGEVERLM